MLTATLLGLFLTATPSLEERSARLLDPVAQAQVTELRVKESALPRLSTGWRAVAISAAVVAGLPLAFTVGYGLVVGIGMIASIPWLALVFPVPLVAGFITAAMLVPAWGWVIAGVATCVAVTAALIARHHEAGLDAQRASVLDERKRVVAASSLPVPPAAPAPTVPLFNL